MFYDKNYQKKFHENLKKRGFNTYTIHNTHDISKFSLLLQKGVNPYQSINDWKILKEISLPEKKKFPCHVNIEDITDGNYVHTKRICKYLKIINLGDYCSLCLKNALLLADKFENFQNMS